MKSKVCFIISFVVSVVLCVAGFVVPPTGVIDGSVLTAVGLLLGFGTVAQLPTLIKDLSRLKIEHHGTIIEAEMDDDDDKE